MVSIIIPVYNGEKYLEQAIVSIIKQTYNEIEIIVVDDGSTDNTAHIANKYDVKYIYQNNSGEAVARNTGIEASRGEFIAFCDADDLYRYNKIQRQLDTFNEFPSADVVYCDVDLVNKNLEIISRIKAEVASEKAEDFLSLLIYRQIIPCTPAIMFKRKCIASGLRYNAEYSQATDYDFIIKLAEKFEFKYLQESLYLYRRHENNATNNHKKQMQSEIEIIKKMSNEEIKHTIAKSSFNDTEKEFLYSKIMIKIGEWMTALNSLKALDGKLEDPYFYFYMGNCYYEINQINSAKEKYLQSLMLNDGNAEVYNNLGCCYIKTFEYDEAKNNFIKALDISPQYMDAKKNLECILSVDTLPKLTIRELRKQLMIY